MTIPEASSRTARYLVFGLLVLIWGSTWFAIKIGIQYFPPLFSIAVRFCVAGSIFLLAMKLRGIPIPWREHRAYFIVVGLLSFVVSFGVVYWAQQYISSGLNAVLFATLPLLTGLVSLVMLQQERLTRGRLAGLLLGLSGIVVINSGDLEQIHPLAPVAALVVLISPTVSAVASVLSKQRSAKIHPWAMAGIPMLFGGVVDAVLSLLLERGRPLIWEWPGIASLLYLTLMGSLVTFGGYFWLLRQMEVGRVNLIAYLTPIIALAIGFSLGHETLSTTLLAGTVLVLLGVATAGRRTSTGTSTS